MNFLFQADTATPDTTPILDSGVLPPRSRGGTPKVLATGLVLGVTLMELLTLLGGMWYEQWPAVFLLLFILAITIHELGHLIAGWAVGFHFAYLQIGPVLLDKQYGVFRARFSIDMMALGYTGMYSDRVRKLRRRSLIYIAGGPGANLITVLIVVVVSNLFPSHSTSGVVTAAGQLGAISLLLAMVSLVPLSSNDGALIEMLLNSPFAARRFISTLALGAQYNQGLRARDWKQTWLRSAINIPDESVSDFYASWMAYLAANDRKDADLAAQYLEHCLRITPVLTRSLRHLVAQEASVFNAWFRVDPNLAQKWLLHVKQERFLLPFQEARIEVALKCARRDYESAMAEWEKGFGLVQALPINPSTTSLKESWLEWRLEIQERKTQP
jgi:hypothetical protein